MTTENAQTARAPYSSLTASEYAPYHTMKEFQWGFSDYQNCTHTPVDPDSAAGQAYDRGAEFAMRLAYIRNDTEQNVGAN